MNRRAYGIIVVAGAIVAVVGVIVAGRRRGDTVDNAPSASARSEDAHSWAGVTRSTADEIGVLAKARAAVEAIGAERWDDALAVASSIRQAAGEDRRLVLLADRIETSMLGRAGRGAEMDANIDGILSTHSSAGWRTGPAWKDYVAMRLLTPDGVGPCRTRLETLPESIRPEMENAFWERISEAASGFPWLPDRPSPDPLGMTVAAGGGQSPPFDKLLPSAIASVGLAAAQANQRTWLEEAIRRLEDAEKYVPPLYQAASDLMTGPSANADRCEFWSGKYLIAVERGEAALAETCADGLVAGATGLATKHLEHIKTEAAKGLAAEKTPLALGPMLRLLSRLGTAREDKVLASAAYRTLLAVSVYEPEAIAANVAAADRMFKDWGMSLRAIANAKSFILHGPSGPDGVAKTADDVASPWAGEFRAGALIGEGGTKLVRDALTRASKDDCIRRGWLLTWLDRRAHAAAEFEVAYRAADATTEAITRVVKPTGRSLVLWSGTLAAADQYVKWRQFGPEGPDGKSGTADDLSDPLAEHLAAAKE